MVSCVNFKREKLIFVFVKLLNQFSFLVNWKVEPKKFFVGFKAKSEYMASAQERIVVSQKHIRTDKTR